MNKNNQIAFVFTGSIVLTAAISSYITRINRDMKWMSMAMEMAKELREENRNSYSRIRDQD